MSPSDTPGGRRHRRGAVTAAVVLAICAVAAWALVLIPGGRTPHQPTIAACLTAGAVAGTINLLFQVPGPRSTTGRPWLQARELDLLRPDSTFLLANYWQGARAIGGAIVVTPTVVRFVPNRMEQRWFRARPFTEQIADCRLVSAEAGPRGLVIATASGAVLRFTVADVGPIARAIRSD